MEQLFLFMLMTFGAIMAIWFIIRLIMVFSGSAPSVMNVCMKCRSEINEAHYKYLYDRELSCTQDFNEEIDSLEKFMRKAKTIQNRRGKQSSGILGVIDSFIATPNQDKFNELERLRIDMSAQLNRALYDGGQIAEIRNEVRNIAIQDMKGIMALVDCFSEQLIEVNSTLSKDKQLYIPVSGLSARWSDAVRAYSPPVTDIGSSVFMSGLETGGKAGLGLMALGGAVSALEAYSGKVMREANYANAIPKIIADFKRTLDAGLEAQERINKTVEYSQKLRLYHNIYVSRLDQLMQKISNAEGINVRRSRRNLFPVRLDNEALGVMMKLVENYNDMNQRVVGAVE